MKQKDGKYTRDPGLPWVFIGMYMLGVVLYSVLYLFCMSYLYKRWDGSSLVFFAVVSLLVSLVVGFFFGGFSGSFYGNRSINYMYASAILVVALAALYGWLLFGSAFLDSYEGYERTAMAIMGVALGIEPVVQVVAAVSIANMDYCPSCDLTGTVEVAEKENEETTYGYEFRDHPSKIEKSTIKNIDTSEQYVVSYETPAYQENLGLHKYHKYTQVFRCKCCGYEKREAARDVTKV